MRIAFRKGFPFQYQKILYRHRKLPLWAQNAAAPTVGLRKQIIRPSGRGVPGLFRTSLYERNWGERSLIYEYDEAIYCRAGWNPLPRQIPSGHNEIQVLKFRDNFGVYYLSEQGGLTRPIAVRTVPIGGHNQQTYFSAAEAKEICRCSRNRVGQSTTDVDGTTEFNMQG
jgi:hypothetical protein